MLLGNILLSSLILRAGVSIAATWVSKGQKEDSVFSLSSKMSVPKNHTSSKAKRLEDYALITAKDVFHTTKDTAKTARKDQGEEIKVTELNLELKGTVVGDRKGSYAFIMDKGSRNEEVHYVNDYVMEVQILRIMKGRVILNVEGREEALFKGEGGYTGKDQQVLYTVITFRELSRLKGLIRRVDPDAFVVVSETLEVMGHRIGNQPHW